MKKIVVAVVLIGALAAGGFYLYKSKGNGVQFRTEKVTRGDLRASVTATGQVSAVTTVLVGTQVSGTVKEIFVDFNSPVKKGQLLAQIDPALPQARVAQARANLLSAEANVAEGGGRPQGCPADAGAEPGPVRPELHRPERPGYGGDE